MGFNTTVLILNDGFDQLQKHSDEFVQQINRLMHDGGSGGVGCHANPIQVMRTDHADVFRLYGSWRNLMVELSPWSKGTEELIVTHPDLVQGYIDHAKRELDQLQLKLKGH